MSDPSRLRCPACDQEMARPARRCPQCNLDLFAAATESQRVQTPGRDKDARVPQSMEELVPRLGEYLVDAGVIAVDQLAYALRVQQERQLAGERILIGQVLVNLGFIDRVGLDRFIATQIVNFKAALEATNRQLEERVAQRTRELAVTLERLSELDRLKANLVATVSHELIGPLQIVLGHSELLARGTLGELSPGQHRSIGSVRRASLTLQELIDELLQFGSAVSGQLPLSMRPMVMATAVQSAVDHLQPRAETAQISIATQIDEAVPQVHADQEKITWVIGQFLDNAIKFTPTGGEVIVSTMMDQDSVVVAVSDTGIGIPAERQEEVFEPLHQLDGSLTRRYPGVGLGLSLARCIVEAHQSEIEVESHVDEGSRFAFRLPILRA